MRKKRLFVVVNKKIKKNNTMAKYLDPKADLTFKKILANK